ncbi:MAG: hypothetical protein IKL92_02925, partial [Oscillospiraceae bacterium]|nr:hypothetical protein [Oscillospiraceae bacterium]
PYKYVSTTKTMVDATTANIDFGTTLYYYLANEAGLVLSQEKSVSGLKVSADWDEGAEFVSGVEIVKKTGNGITAAKNIYYLAVNTVKVADVDAEEVSGAVLFKGRSGDSKTKIDGELEVAFTLGYAAGTVNADKASVSGKTLKVYDFSGLDDDAAATEEYEVTFGGEFVVTANVKTEKKVLMACDETVIDEIDEAYPEANLDYYACTGAFKKTAKVVVTLDEGEEFLYEVVDGQLVEVDGDYDEWAEEFTFKTKKLGTYVISDVELEVASEVVATNPSTGAAA